MPSPEKYARKNLIDEILIEVGQTQILVSASHNPQQTSYDQLALKDYLATNDHAVYLLIYQ